MGVAYAKKHLPEQTERSRTYATSTWTTVPLPVKVVVGYPIGKCIITTRDTGAASADLILVHSEQRFHSQENLSPHIHPKTSDCPHWCVYKLHIVSFL